MSEDLERKRDIDIVEYPDGDVSNPKPYNPAGQPAGSGTGGDVAGTEKQEKRGTNTEEDDGA